MFTLENCKGLSPKIQPQVGGLQLADIKSIQVISKCIQVLCYDLLCDWAGQKPSFCRNVQDVFSSALHDSPSPFGRAGA